MNKLIIILLAVFSYNTTEAQKHYGMKFDGGVSNLKNTFTSFDTRKYDNIKKSISPTINAGFFYKNKFQEHSVLGLELMYSFVQDKGTNTYESEDYAPNGEYLGSYKYERFLSIKIHYLNIPIYYGYNVGKLLFKAGLQFGIPLSAERELDVKYYKNNKFETQYTYKAEISAFDFGTKFGINYSISKKFSFNFDYYIGMKNIGEGHYDSKNYELKNGQLTAGIEYRLQ